MAIYQLNAGTITSRHADCRRMFYVTRPQFMKAESNLFLKHNLLNFYNQVGTHRETTRTQEIIKKGIKNRQQTGESKACAK